MPFLDSDTCAEGGYLFLPGFSSLYDGIHGWMTRRMDEWMTGWMHGKSFKTTTSFTSGPVPNAQVCYFNNVWFMFWFFFKTFIFFIFYLYVFSVIIIILYNKTKVFLFHFCIFVYLDASLKFGERRHTSFFFK